MPSKCETTTWSTVAQRENRSAKKRLQLSSESDSTVRTNAGRLFHTREVATENAQSTKTDHLVWYSMVQQSLTTQSTHYRSFWRQFYGSHDPTNSVIALKDDGQSTMSRANPTRLSSLKGKEKDVSKKINISHHEDQRHRGAWKTES